MVEKLYHIYHLQGMSTNKTCSLRSVCFLNLKKMAKTNFWPYLNSESLYLADISQICLFWVKKIGYISLNWQDNVKKCSKDIKACQIWRSVN